MTPQPPKPSMLSLVDGSWQVVARYISFEILIARYISTIGQPLRFWLQPNAEDQARGLKPGLGATTMAINGAIGLNLTLFVLFTLPLQSVDRVQATAEQV